jgi:FtsX-like permease family
MRSFTVRRMGSVWPLIGCLAASVLVTSALVGALVSVYATSLPAAVSRQLADSGAMSVAVSGAAKGQVPAQVAAVRGRLRAAFGEVPYHLFSAIWSDSLAAGVGQRPGQLPVIEAAAVGDITASARLTSGTWPAGPPSRGPVPAALPTAAASDLGLHTGSVVSLRDLTTGETVSLRITGLYRPAQPASSYWLIDLVGTSGVSESSGFASYGPAVVSAAAFASAGGPLAVSQLSFVALPRAASIAPSELTTLAARLSAAVAAVDSAGQLTATTSMPQTLTNAAAGLAAGKSLVLISGLVLLLLAGAALGLAGRLLASYRDGETALLSARGAGRGQLVRPSLAEAVLAVGVTAAAGAVAGSWLSAAALAHLTRQPASPRTSAWPAQSWPALGGALPGGAVWLSAAALAVFCLGIIVWPAARPAGKARLRLPLRHGRSVPVAAVISAGADVALVVLALLSVEELRSYSAAKVISGGGLDPVIALAPALALAGLAIVPLRLLPVVTRWLEHLTARGRRLGYAMASWQISRRPLRQTGPALLVVLAVGASTLALSQYESWRRSVLDQAAFDAGAAVRVQLAQSAPLAGVSRISGLPGVSAAMPVSAVPLLASGQLLVLDAALAARTVVLRPDLASVSAPRLFRAITVPRAGLVLPGRPARLAITASMSALAETGPVSATVTIQDADGVGYAVPTSAMPADGKPHALVAKLASSGAVYPLRLTGISVSYGMPAYRQSVRTGDQQATLQVDGVTVSPATTGPFSRVATGAQALRGWAARTADPDLAAELAVLGGATDEAVRPAIGAVTVAGADERIAFGAGRWPQLPGGSPPPGQAELDLSIPAGRPVPVIAAASYAAANGLRRGSVFSIAVAGEQVSGRLVATVSAFPGGGTLVADQAAVQDALTSMGAGGSLPATQWWLETAGGAAPAGLPPGSAVTSAATLATRLAHDPISAAPVQAAAAVAAAAALLAALGFCVSVTASARERRPQRAVLGALGVLSSTQASVFCLEEALIAVPAAAVGLLIGVGLAHLLVPALTLTATGGPPVPSVLVSIPWGLVLAVAIGLPAIPVLAAAVSSLREPDAAAELRASEAVA